MSASPPPRLSLVLDISERRLPSSPDRALEGAPSRDPGEAGGGVSVGVVGGGGSGAGGGVEVVVFVLAVLQLELRLPWYSY